MYSNNPEKVTAQAISEGVDCVLAKPINYEIFKEALKKYGFIKT